MAHDLALPDCVLAGQLTHAALPAGECVYDRMSATLMEPCAKRSAQCVAESGPIRAVPRGLDALSEQVCTPPGRAWDHLPAVFALTATLLCCRPFDPFALP